MARGVNKVILVGNVGVTPELRQTTDGTSVVTLSLATSESWKDKQTGQKQERTEWHRVVFFRQLADIVSQYVRKGAKLYVEGSIRTRKWVDQQGVERYSTEIMASDMQMLDSRESGAGYAPPVSAYADQSQPASAGQAAAANPSEVMMELDDDVPF